MLEEVDCGHKSELCFSRVGKDTKVVVGKLGVTCTIKSVEFLAPKTRLAEFFRAFGEVGIWVHRYIPRRYSYTLLPREVQTHYVHTFHVYIWLVWYFYV